MNQADLFAGHLDGAAGLAFVQAGDVQGAAVVNDPLFPAVEHDGAVDIADGLSFDDTFIINHRFDDIVSVLRTEDDLAAFGHYSSFVEDAVFQFLAIRAPDLVGHGLVNGKADHFIAHKIESGLLAGTQVDCAKVGQNITLVDNAGSQEGDMAALGRRDGPLVDDGRKCGVKHLVEDIITGEKVFVIDIQGA